jgi:hypothetical protein
MEIMKPALTAEEWAKGKPGVFGWDDGSAFVDWRNGTTGAEAPHAIAAVCLHGKSFGFTWDDVEMVRNAVGMIESEWGSDGNMGGPLLDVADRIAALLPPREK